jgi:hypothetical protein
MEQILYHGTNKTAAENILLEGLCGGNNTVGGNRGIWSVPLLFTAEYKQTAEAYGAYVLIIKIPQSLWEESTHIVDQMGDDCRVFEGEGVLIPSDYITCPLIDHEMGLCDEDCEFCNN